MLRRKVTRRATSNPALKKLNLQTQISNLERIKEVLDKNPFTSFGTFRKAYYEFVNYGIGASIMDDTKLQALYKNLKAFRDLGYAGTDSTEKLEDVALDFISHLEDLGPILDKLERCMSSFEVWTKDCSVLLQATNQLASRSILELEEEESGF